ncbi:hypothetical protein M5K25_025537 [Dendrobium thyrsiflorum]|uniref:Uncharacterized protein n=1 Tax=Dendrobium thyrsiflorum TaxID=117978 RepID=A0ABD0U9P0_DENTH
MQRRCRMNLKKAGCVADVVANETLAGDPDLVLINGRLRSRFLDSLVSVHDYGDIRVRASVGLGDDKTQEVGGRSKTLDGRGCPARGVRLNLSGSSAYKMQPRPR